MFEHHRKVKQTGSKNIENTKKHGRKVIETRLDEIACRRKSETDKACMLREEFSKQVKGAAGVLKTFSKGSGILCEPAKRGKQGKGARRGSGAECILTRFC